MLDSLKNSLMAGLGATVITREKLNKTMDRLVEEGKLTSEEADRLAKDLEESGRREWSDFQERILNTVREGMDNLDIASRTNLNALESRVANLEKRMSMVEDQVTRPKE